MADISTLISAIPDAVDGQPIGSNYHNSLKAALQVIAQNLGVSGPPQTTLSFAAPFQPNGAQPAWQLDSTGTATKIVGQTQAEGWFLVQLPSGASIQQVLFFGRKTNLAAAASAPIWSGQLFRQPIVFGAGAALALFTADLDGAQTDANGNFREPAVSAVTSRVVDNDNFKYIITSKLQNANPAGEARISGVQIVYGQAASASGSPRGPLF